MLPTTDIKECISISTINYRQNLCKLLSGDLDFQGKTGDYSSHNFHSFPAKFPPQLPAKFIVDLTCAGETVLDPMMGSGTTILEAYLSGRKSIGIDIDPLAVLITKVKVTPLNKEALLELRDEILLEAYNFMSNRRQQLEETLINKWDPKTMEFVNYWFGHETQLELMALLEQIQKLSNIDQRSFFLTAFSSIIITKSGGVSLALDLGHTRPHKAAHIVNKRGEQIYHGADNRETEVHAVMRKTIGSALDEFRHRVDKNLKGVLELGISRQNVSLGFGDAQHLPIADNSVSLIVTSPPYASNAIDYMRAHKFSLTWLGYDIDNLAKRRKEYIGAESASENPMEVLPSLANEIVGKLEGLDKAKGTALRRYYSEMTRSLREMYRVLKSGRAAVIVVGSSINRGVNTETGECLAEIASSIGFEHPIMGIRQIDRNRRMMPVGLKPDLESQIQQRMHEETVIGLIKPNNSTNIGIKL
jgi:DNA modification methylase